jgi:predicted Ser/Thr protein kinase
MVVKSIGQPGQAGDCAQSGYEIKPPRNATKARVTKSMRLGRAVVVKDYSRCHAVIKMLYGRPALRREARAYAQLQGIPGIPECFGLAGRDRLFIEYISGRLLGNFERGDVAPAVFDRLDAIVQGAHARGVALVDLHSSNIIISDSGDVFLIDFANALFARDSRRPNMLVRLFMELDRHAAGRMRARYLRQPYPVSAGLFGVLYRIGRGLKTASGRIKKLFHLES